MPVSPCARGGARSTRGASILFSPSLLNYRLPRLFALGGKLRCLMRLASLVPPLGFGSFLGMFRRFPRATN